MTPKMMTTALQPRGTTTAWITIKLVNIHYYFKAYLLKCHEYGVILLNERQRHLFQRLKASFSLKKNLKLLC